ncbi:MAG TPA: hypothetical protein VE988_17715, partial [Gemmataceae bacterium]|nr:hypothetical protein [Gemmataceae bacterium]
ARDQPSRNKQAEFPPSAKIEKLKTAQAAKPTVAICGKTLCRVTGSPVMNMSNRRAACATAPEHEP